MRAAPLGASGTRSSYGNTNIFTYFNVMVSMRSAPAAAILLAVLAPAAAHAAYWEPGIGAAPETHYTICDTMRQFCYSVDLEFLIPALH